MKKQILSIQAKKWLSNFHKNPIPILDLIGIISGIVLVAIGLYKIYPPAMYIIIGGILAFPGIKSKAVK